MFARFTFRKMNSAASRLSSWISNSNTLNKSGAKGNKQNPFKTRRLGKIALPKLPRGNRVLLAVLLLASSAIALTSLGVRRAMLSGNDAAFVSQSVPATMTAGESYAVTVTMLNQGTTTWTPGQAYRLGSQNPQDNTTWMMTTNRVNLLAGDSVSPGATTTFSFVVTAPSSPGSYNFQWQMVQELVEWFGAKAPNIAVQVVPRPVSTKLKEYVYAGGRLITSEEKSCVPTLNPLTASHLVSGGTGSFDVSISECNWNATSSAGWITINGSSSGVGAGTVNYSVAANSGPQRTGTITVNGQAFTIAQAPNQASCAYSLNTPGKSVSEQAGSDSFTLTTGAGCAWNASSNASWLTVTSPASGSGSGSSPISYSVVANPGPQRSGMITVGGKTFTVTQDPNPATCSYALSPSSWTYGPGSASGSFNVTTQAGCRWDAATNVGWLVITGGGVGVGNGTVSFDVQSNTGGQRTGAISVRGQNFTVTQEPNQTTCTFALNPSSWQYPVEGGTGSFSITTGTGCHWDAVPSAGWITVASPGSGVGNGSVGFTVQANNGDLRAGTISVRGQVFTVVQCGFVVSPTSKSFTWSGGPGSVTVNSGNHTCSWSAVSNAPWITITSGASGTQFGTINYSVAQYGVLDGVRSGTLTVAGQTVTIVQTGTFDPCIKKPWLCDPLQSTSLDQSAPGAEPRGLTARYFSNTTLSGQPELQRTDAVINFDWAGARSDAAPPADGFSARWSGQLNAPSSEAYTFYLYSDDGARLWVNNKLVIDRWQSPFKPETQSVPVELKAGERADIRVEYYNVGGKASIQLLWGSASTPRQIIPQRYFYPEATANESTPTDVNKQTGMLSPPGSDAGPKAAWPRLSAPGRWLAIPPGRAGLILLIASGVLAFLLLIGWGRARGWFAVAAACVVSRLRDQITWLGVVMRLGGRKLAGLSPEMARAMGGRALSVRRGFSVARLKLTLRRALVIAVIVGLALPLTPAQADGLVRAARTTWRGMGAYFGSAKDRSTDMASGGRRGEVVSAASQSGQVADLQVCPTQLIMFVGERYTLTPVALDGSQHVVHGAGMRWSSLNAAVADVSSFGQVEAVAVGTTAVEVQSGAASKQITVEVRGGMRPTDTNQQADLDPTAGCAAEQAAMYAPQSAAVAGAQEDPIDNTVLVDWDPLPEPNSRAAHFRNAVGSPRFAAKSQGVQLGSSNYQFNVPVANVGARGASANVGMTFNSRTWNAEDGKLKFNYVGAYPAPGWTMGYGKIIRNYNATAAGDHSGVGSGNSPGDYLLVEGDGTRTRLAAKYDAARGRYLHEADDGSFRQFDPRSGEMRYPDGTRMVYSSVNGALLPTAMINSNGGAITMTYRDYCEGAGCLRVFRHRTALSAVRDTLGRYVTFHYYGDADYPAAAADGRPGGELAAIKAPDMDGVQREIIRVEYQYVTLKYDFGGVAVDAPANNSQIQVVRRIYYPQTGRGFLFLDYSSYGMPRKISTRMGMTGAGGAITDGVEIAYTTYNYTTIAIDPNDSPYNRNQVGSLSDFPQFTRREEWWQGKTDADGAPTTAPTTYVYSRTTDGSTETTTIEYVGKNCKEVTTMGTDGGQLSFGKVISVERKKSEPEQVLSKQVFTYTTGPDGEAEVEKIETFDEAGQGRLVKFGYGRYGRVINQYDYGYKQGGAYQVRRRTQYDYLDAQNYLDARFLRLARIVSAYDAKNNNDDADDELKAKTETTYDGYTDPDVGGIENYGLTSGQYPPNHDATYDQNKTLRGNATAVKTFSQFSPGEVSTTRHAKYDIFGNVVEAEVSCCVKKFFGFSGVTAYSQPDWVRSGGDTGLSLQTTYQHNYFTGLVEEETNPDGLRTHYDYDNALRLNQVILHVGLQQDLQVVETKKFDQDGNGNDLLTYISQTSYADQGTQKVIASKQWFDGSGRVIRAGTGTGAAPDSYNMVATIYDGWGRVAKQSNPYLGDASGGPQAGGAQFWTTNTYDELSRVIKVTLPDNQFIQVTYSGATATGGATVVTTDTVGRKRKSEADGLGRFVKVTEQNPANGNLEWETSYSYDVLNNLTQTNQGGQIRTFTYDAKSRLKSETTPEAGQITYDYTDFDAVKTRTDARGVVTTYTYGDLNLLTGVSYNNVTGVAPTAPVSIDYRDASPGKGQMERVTDGMGTESYGYDSFGRIESCTRVIDGISYEKRYEYNALGQMTLMIYPSGKRVKVAHDDRGRLAALQRVDVSGAAQETYLNEINYRADGQISSQKLGDGTTESLGYSNDRLQLTSQTVTKGSNTLLDLSYGYGAGAGQMGSGSTVGNSGQLVNINGTINGQGRHQAFTYDNVGRLVTATGWGSWARRFDYDRQGNQTAVWDAVGGGNQLQNTVMEQVGGIKTNRIASVNGTAFSYDASGNVTGDGARSYTYDAQSRIVSVNGLSSESYGYDAGNRRVRKQVGGVVTHYIWEGNQVIAEYERGGSAQATGTRYYHQDRLSTRVITDGAGNVKGTTDHLPFGEEIGGSDESEKHKFTTYELDGTGLHYAVNRYYASQQGRFNQADPLGMGAASLAAPQSLNLYSYVQNDPLNAVDPSGTMPGFCGAEYNYGQCSGSGGFGGGGGGGGLSPHIAEALRKHDRRVANDRAGWGFSISEDHEGGEFEPALPVNNNRLLVIQSYSLATGIFNQKNPCSDFLVLPTGFLK